MSYSQKQLGNLTNIFKKSLLKFDWQLRDYLNESIKFLVMKKLVLERDAIQIQTQTWKDAAIKNWLNETQFSSRCPECQIDITGPRKLIHCHLKWHDAKRSERRENEHFNQKFRIHFPTLKEF